MNPENLLKERFKHYEIKHTKKKTKKNPYSIIFTNGKSRGSRPQSAPFCTSLFSNAVVYSKLYYNMWHMTVYFQTSTSSLRILFGLSRPGLLKQISVVYEESHFRAR